MPLAGGGALAVAGCPIKFAGEPAPLLRPAPALDQHRAALLAELGVVP